MTEEELVAVEAENETVLARDAEAAENAADPDPTSVESYVFAPAWQCQETATPADGDKWKIREAINETLHAEFQRNENTFLWGQDVASKEKGGVFLVTKGMEQAFGSSRVFNAPIAEDFIVGTANGMARYRDDIRCVIEAAQFADYVWPAMEQIVEMSHEYWRTKGQFSPNVTMRLSSGGYIGGGLYHSQNTEAFQTLPGVRIVVPAFADDAAGLLRTYSLAGHELFLEPKFLYNQGFVAPRCSTDHAVPFSKHASCGQRRDDRGMGHAGALSLRAANKAAKKAMRLRSSIYVPFDRGIRKPCLTCEKRASPHRS